MLCLYENHITYNEKKNLYKYMANDSYSLIFFQQNRENVRCAVDEAFTLGGNYLGCGAIVNWRDWIVASDSID